MSNYDPLPGPGTPEASAMLDTMLAEYNYPANTKNAARAGYQAARRMLRAMKPPQSLPPGWRVKLNGDGSYGIFGPAPLPGENPRTSHCIWQGDKSDLADLVRRLCVHVLAQQLDQEEAT